MTKREKAKVRNFAVKSFVKLVLETRCALRLSLSETLIEKGVTGQELDDELEAFDKETNLIDVL